MLSAAVKTFATKPTACPAGTLSTLPLTLPEVSTPWHARKPRWNTATVLCRSKSASPPARRREGREGLVCEALSAEGDQAEKEQRKGHERQIVVHAVKRDPDGRPIDHLQSAET